MKAIKNIITVCVLCASIIGFTACEKEDRIWVYYDATRCGNLWQYNEKMGYYDETRVFSKSQVKRNVKKYLKNRQIEVFKVEFTYNGIVDECRCCDCRTGSGIKCEILESDLQKAIEENFYQ